MKTITRFLTVSTAFALLAAPWPAIPAQQAWAAEPIAPVPSLATEDTAPFPNPERGWFKTVSPIYSTNTPAPPLNLNQLLEWRKEEKVTLVRKYYLLYRYKNTALPQSVLDELQHDLEVCRLAGFKLIPRFTYSYYLDYNGDESKEDAPLTQVLTHINQIKPYIQANGDVIDHWQAGFVGYWGEWHTSTNNLVDNTTKNVNDNSKQIIDALLDATPKDRSIVLRRPLFKMTLQTEAETNPTTALVSEDDLPRIGHMNDAFIADATDMGTYDRNNLEQREKERAYLSEDTKTVIMSGEPGTFHKDYTTGDQALAEMAKMHWSSMNKEQPGAITTGVYDNWKQTGADVEMTKRLGYRFLLDKVSATTTVKPGGPLTLNVDVINNGFAHAHNPHLLEAILRHKETKAEYIVRLPEDITTWQAGTTKSISFTAGLPSDIPSGSYDLLLHLPDKKLENSNRPDLYSRPEYAIRFANQQVWEESTGYNNLNLTVQVESGAVAEPSSSTLPVFAPKAKPQDQTAPIVTSISTQSQEVSTAPGSQLVLTFDEIASVTTELTKFQLRKDGQTIPATYSLEKNQLTITSSQWLDATHTYTVTIPAGTFRDKAGNMNQQPYDISLTVSPQIVTNPSFETYTGTNGVANGWFPLGNSTAAFSVTNQHATAGSQSQKISIANLPAAGNYTAIAQIIPVEAGRSYKLTGQFYVESLVNGNVQLYVDFYDAAGAKGNLVGSKIISKAAAPDTSISLEISDTIPAAAKSARVYAIIRAIGANASGTVYIDDMQMNITPLPVTP
ncbi:DUF4832 domain-containing protein [Brevibacillus dissolubilis]|uniref:DUF4832 domain-containing protein n=1 Tax=Brevibacillus dissolubilis TaxID=1844116 RepID=UPI00159BE6E2|nr:DUF4832 domain-containing protein [Brevibacillus dissolubilis]